MRAERSQRTIEDSYTLAESLSALKDRRRAAEAFEHLRERATIIGRSENAFCALSEPDREDAVSIVLTKMEQIPVLTGWNDRRVHRYLARALGRTAVSLWRKSRRLVCVEDVPPDPTRDAEGEDRVVERLDGPRTCLIGILQEACGADARLDPAHRVARVLLGELVAARVDSQRVDFRPHTLRAWSELQRIVFGGRSLIEVLREDGQPTDEVTRNNRHKAHEAFRVGLRTTIGDLVASGRWTPERAEAGHLAVDILRRDRAAAG
jgi:hypothetical protein